jgi:hypothetical protein
MSFDLVKNQSNQAIPIYLYIYTNTNTQIKLQYTNIVRTLLTLTNTQTYNHIKFNLIKLLSL